MTLSYNGRIYFFEITPKLVNAFAVNFLTMCKIIFTHFLKILCYLSNDIGFESILPKAPFVKYFKNF